MKAWHKLCLKFRFRFSFLFFLTVDLFFSPAADYLLTNPSGVSSPFYLAAQEDAFQKGLSALKENRFEAALEELTTAEREHPFDARVRNFRGIVLARLGRNSEAVAEYREAIRLDPGMEDAYRNLGFLEWTEHQLERAREELERAVKLSPDDSFAHYYLGRVKLDAKLYVQAFQELDQYRMLWPSDAEFLIEVAKGYVGLQRLEEARKALDHLATLPLSDSQSVNVAALLLSIHENGTAINLLRKLSNGQAADPALWAQFDLALAYLLAGNYQNAADQARFFTERLHLAHSESADSAPAWSLLGVAYARLGQGERAVKAFQQAATIAPGQEEHWLNLTRELMELRYFAAANAAVQKGLASNPNSYALHLRLGATYLSADRYAEAESVFRNLVVAGDPLPTSYIGLAQVLLRTGRAEEASSELAAAGKKLGPNFLISYFRGLALDRAGKPGEAISTFAEAVRLNPRSAEAHFGLGKTELAINRVSDATAELEETLRLAPGNVQARRLLSQAYRRAGDAKTALKYATEAAEALPAAEGDLMGDFLLPPWQLPPEKSR